MGTAEVQGDLWGRAARDWVMIQEPMHRPLFEAMLDEALVSSGTKMLDAGCGGGESSVMAVERGAEISGIDAAEKLISLAKERLPQGDFRVGDIERLPFEDNVFDVVFAANSVQFSGDRVATLRGFTRVCRSGGRIVVGLFGPPEGVAHRAIMSAVGEASPNPPTGAGPFELSMPGKLESLFGEAGLNVLKSGEVDCPFYYPDFETFWRASASAGPAQGVMGIIGQEKLKEVVREAAEPFREDGGGVSIRPNIFKYVVATL